MELIQRRNASRRLWKRNRELPDKIRYDHLSVGVRGETVKASRVRRNSHVSSLSFDDNSLWHITKSLRRRTKIRSPPIEVQNHYVYDPQYKVHIRFLPFS